MAKHLLFIIGLLLGSVAFGQSRNNDPVVVKGSNLSCMIGVQPSLIVAYKFNGTNLVQIPMQVDEVVVKEASAPYNNLGCGFGTVSNSNSYDNISFYADANTFTGPDTNLLFDVDDEVVFMAKDAGSKLTICPPTPTGVVSNSTCELELRDPINNAVLGYVYLFQQNGTLNQSAGVNYVTYNFTFANNYKTAYDICTGGVTENSTVTTANYSMKFTKRCIEEELKISAGGASNIDILDRHQFFVAPNNCFRSEQTFSDSRGTVVTSINGPVRAIRSVMGANSGVGTQWTIKFTESRLDYQMDFRVHPIGGFFDVLDLNSNAVGMMYYNSQNPNGVQINGVQDVLVTTNPNVWELYTGSQGSIAVGYDYQTDIPLGASSFVEAYFDDGGTTNPKHICTGDGFAYGASGFHLATGLCTDYWATASGCGQLASYFRLNRRNYILPPSTTPAQASTYANYGNNPITTTPSVALLSSFCSSVNYNVTTSSSPAAGGTTSGSGSYTSGSSVTVTATANSGYTFSNWTENGTQVSTSASYTFTVSSNRNLVANFTQNTTNFTVTTSSSPAAGGTTSGGGSYANGASATVTATANSGYTFSRWTENGTQVSTSASYTFTVSANRNLVANFTQNTANFTVTTSSSPAAGGTTSGGGSYTSGASVTVTATANIGYTFSRWTENGTQVSTSASYTFTVSANRNLVANFNQNTQYNCGVPTNLTATSITGTTAIIGWSFATAPSFRLRYRQVGTTNYSFKTFSPASGVFTYQLTGLKRNTSYEVSLQSVCSTASSAFSTPITFRTTSATVRLTDHAAINGINDVPAFKVFPNPSSGLISIEAPFEGEMILFNSAGQEIKKVALNGNLNEVEIQENGIYLLLIRDTIGNIYTDRVIIRR